MGCHQSGRAHRAVGRRDGTQAEQLRPALIEGILSGAARFSYGDAMTQQNLTDLLSVSANPTGASVAAGLESAGFTAVPALDLSPSEPVTVGLGDSFVGGFLAGLYRSGVPADPVRRAATLVAPYPTTSGLQ
jgi:hypothetical protein